MIYFPSTRTNTEFRLYSSSHTQLTNYRVSFKPNLIMERSITHPLKTAAAGIKGSRTTEARPDGNGEAKV
jgi:hypothetical protein